MDENTTLPKNDGNTKKRQQRVSLEEWIARMKLAFSNGKLPDILPQLSVLGYNEAKLDELMGKVTELEELDQKQKKEYAEQYEETSKVDEKRAEIDEKYKRHLALCRILFKKDIKATAVLELNGKRKIAYGSWFYQVSNFYAQLSQNSEFLDKLKSIGIQKSALQEMKTLLSEISELKKSQKKETGEAQKATETRDKAFDELYPQYADLIAYAKVVLNDEQHLEAMGIVVKR